MGNGDQNDHAEPTDAQQIAASLTDPNAFTTLFERHAGQVHRYLTKRVGRRDAEDLVGETFGTAFRRRRSYDLSRDDARPWLFGIATNLARHHWRSERRRLRRDGTTASMVDLDDELGDAAVSHVFFQGHSESIARALDQLDDTYLDVLLLVGGLGLTYEEVSVALGIPVGTVRSRLSRARRFLRALLGDPGQYLDDEARVEQPPVSSEGSP